MSKLTPSSEDVTPEIDANAAQRVSTTVNTRRTTSRNGSRQVLNISRDFGGATPSIGDILALHSKNIAKKLTMILFVKSLAYT